MRQITVGFRRQSVAVPTHLVANFNDANAGNFVHEVNPFRYYFQTARGRNGPVVSLKDVHPEPRDRPTMLRVSGVTGNRVFEVEADPIRSGCP